MSITNKDISDMQMRVFASYPEYMTISMAKSEMYKRTFEKLEDTQMFWKMRCEAILQAEGHFDSVDVSDWRDMYQILSIGDNYMKVRQHSIIEKAVNHNSRTAVSLCIIAKMTLEDVQVALRNAVNLGYYDIVEIIYGEYQTTELIEDISIVAIARKGYYKIVEFLLLRANFLEEDLKIALKDCCVLGGDRHILVINELIKYGVDPSFDNNICLQNALVFGNLDVANALLYDDRVKTGTLNIKHILDKTNKYKEVKSFLKKTLYGNSIGGMIMGYIKASGNAVHIPYIFNVENISNEEEFCYRFMAHLVEKRDTLLSNINWLNNEISMSENKYIKKYVGLAAESVYANSTKITRENVNNNLYFAIRGFLLLSYEPEYTLHEITQILTNEGASYEAIQITSGLIGLYLGLDKLKKQSNVPVSFKLLNQVNNYLDNITYLD